MRIVSENELEENARLLWWNTGRQRFQLFHSFEDYAADSRLHARRIIAKVEITKTSGSNIRYMVPNMTSHRRDIYHSFYTQRGNVHERTIGELNLYLKREFDDPKDRTRIQFAPLPLK